MLDGVEFSVIQPYQPEVDGGNWVLGVALAWHKNRLYASYGFNRDPHENTATEQAHCRISDDAFNNGDQQTAMNIHRQMVPIVMTYLSPPYPGKVKALVNLQGRSGGLPRKPILPVTDKAQLDAMQAALETAGIATVEKRSGSDT